MAWEKKKVAKILIDNLESIAISPVKNHSLLMELNNRVQLAVSEYDDATKEYEEHVKKYGKLV